MKEKIAVNGIEIGVDFVLNRANKLKGLVTDFFTNNGAGFFKTDLGDFAAGDCEKITPVGLFLDTYPTQHVFDGDQAFSVNTMTGMVISGIISNGRVGANNTCGDKVFFKEGKSAEFCRHLIHNKHNLCISDWKEKTAHNYLNVFYRVGIDPVSRFVSINSIRPESIWSKGVDLELVKNFALYSNACKYAQQLKGDDKERKIQEEKFILTLPGVTWYDSEIANRWNNILGQMLSGNPKNIFMHSGREFGKSYFSKIIEKAFASSGQVVYKSNGMTSDSTNMEKTPNKENTEDPVILLTQDGVSFRKSETLKTVFCLLPKDNWTAAKKSVLYASKMQARTTPWLFFETEGARSVFIENNKPTHSVAQVMSLIERLLQSPIVTDVIRNELQKSKK